MSAQSSRPRPAPGQVPDAQESRAAVALTVAWMLSCTSTAAAMLVVVALGVLSLIFPFAGPRNPFWAVASVLLFVALATGLLCLVFTPLAYRVRQIPPPRAVAIAAVLIGALPIVTLAVLALIPH